MTDTQTYDYSQRCSDPEVHGAHRYDKRDEKDPGVLLKMWCRGRGVRKDPREVGVPCGLDTVHSSHTYETGDDVKNMNDEVVAKGVAWCPGIEASPKVVPGVTLMEDHIMQFFTYEHLPAALQPVSMPFCTLAMHVVETLPRNPERTTALRKLLEAKDAAVRAQVAK
ncbi:MAG TPA: hypothetical protein PLB92_05855 [Rhodoglobus sp.]|nr:hypothetical protein [Rhodoglobus sp.]